MRTARAWSVLLWSWGGVASGSAQCVRSGRLWPVIEDTGAVRHVDEVEKNVIQSTENC